MQLIRMRPEPFDSGACRTTVEPFEGTAEESRKASQKCRVLIMAREVREQLEQCVTEMRAIVGWPCNGDGDVAQGPQRGIAA